MNNYLLALEPNQSGFDLDKIHNTIVNNSSVTRWWHYLSGTYLLQVKVDADYLSLTLSTAYPGLLYMILKVDISKVNGRLQKSAWESIRDMRGGFIRLKPAQKIPLKTIGYPSTKTFPSQPTKITLEEIKRELDELLKKLEKN